MEKLHVQLKDREEEVGIYNALHRDVTVTFYVPYYGLPVALKGPYPRVVEKTSEYIGGRWVPILWPKKPEDIQVVQPREPDYPPRVDLRKGHEVRDP